MLSVNQIVVFPAKVTKKFGRNLESYHDQEKRNRRRQSEKYRIQQKNGNHIEQKEKKNDEKVLTEKEYKRPIRNWIYVCMSPNRKKIKSPDRKEISK